MHSHITRTKQHHKPNDCGNDFVPIDVFCQNQASQIQGDDNAVVQIKNKPEIPFS
jgi:hypothetical protein